MGKKVLGLIFLTLLLPQFLIAQNRAELEILTKGSVEYNNNAVLEHYGAINVAGGYIKIEAISSTATLSLSDLSIINVYSTGTLDLAGNSASTPVVITRLGTSGTYGIDFGGLGTGAIFKGQYYRIEYVNTDGVVIRTGTKFQATVGAVFSTPASSTSPLLNFAPDTNPPNASDRDNIPRGVKASFYGNQGYNVKAGAYTPRIVFYGNTTDNGNRWGEDYDNDPYDQIDWYSYQVKNLTTNTSYSSLQDAIAAASAGDRLVVGSIGASIIPITDNIVLNKDVIIENALFIPLDGFAVQSNDTTIKGTLRNCIIVKGGVNYVRNENCTFFRYDSNLPVLQITNSTGVNCLIENGSNTTGTTLTSSLTTASASWFFSPADLDLHLKPTATDAIDKGTTLAWPSPAKDFEGNPRPVGSAWDIGADEFAGSGKVPVLIKNLNYARIRRFWYIGPRYDGASDVASYYAVTGGGSYGSGANDKSRHLVVLRANDLEQIASYQASYPIINLF